MIKCNTFIGFGVPRIQDQRVAHGGRLFEEDCEAARAYLGWPHDPLVVPPAILADGASPGSAAAPRGRPGRTGCRASMPASGGNLSG